MDEDFKVTTRMKLGLGLVFVVFVALAFQFGYTAEPKKTEREPTYVENCAAAVVEDIKAHTLMRKSLREAEQMAQEEDLMTQMAPKR